MIKVFKHIITENVETETGSRSGPAASLSLLQAAYKLQFWFLIHTITHICRHRDRYLRVWSRLLVTWCSPVYYPRWVLSYVASGLENSLLKMEQITSADVIQHDADSALLKHMSVELFDRSESFIDSEVFIWQSMLGTVATFWCLLVPIIKPRDFKRVRTVHRTQLPNYSEVLWEICHCGQWKLGKEEWQYFHRSLRKRSILWIVREESTFSCLLKKDTQRGVIIMRRMYYL